MNAPPVADDVKQASHLTIGSLLRSQVTRTPLAPALSGGDRTLSFAAFNTRVNRLAHALRKFGTVHGDRVAILSENRTEYVELEFASAKLGAITCALNWRLTIPELEHCIRLVSPHVLLCSQRYADTLERVRHDCAHILRLGADYEAALSAASDAEPDAPVHPEDGLLVLYTSGTTGLPKGALISHRAEVARMQVNRLDMKLEPGDVFVAWAPMFHMASSDFLISCLCSGGHVIAVDGFDVDTLVTLAARHDQWWPMILPGTVDRFCDAMEARGVTPKKSKLIGAMADLIPAQQIARVTSLLRAPFANTFGATETGVPPASASLVPAGETSFSLNKRVNSLCEIRLVNENDEDVPDGKAGELLIRGPTLFSGYWNAPEATARDFRGGWFHMGDAFRRNPDGSLSFVDRVKYLIKSGGENIYPAEIERVLLADARVAEAVVVRQPDARWGEVPVAFVAAADATLNTEVLMALCRERLAGYKRPKAIHFVELTSFPRSPTGKIQRGEVEKWLR
ncbi:MAG: acyl--CoA ligase [Betaproteobacteria bacterium]|nr:acyl--CoA ligase [Betaproteobacteria bacterium]